MTELFVSGRPWRRSGKVRIGTPKSRQLCAPLNIITQPVIAIFLASPYVTPTLLSLYIKNWALKPGVLRVGELVDVGSGMCAWRCRRLRAAPGDRCRADAACKFLARAPIKGAALLWFGDTRLINTPVHAADERRVECSLAHEQSGVGGGAVLELFDG